MTDLFEQWRAKTTKPRKSVDVCFDRGLLHDFEMAERVANADRGMLDSSARRRLEELGVAIARETHTFVFEGIGQGAWRRLLGEHPPTPEQKAEFGGVLDYNPETFPAVAIAACCVDPGLSVEQAQWFCDEFPHAVIERVWGTVLDANVIGGDEKKAVTARPLGGEKKQTPPSPSESLGASS